MKFQKTKKLLSVLTLTCAMAAGAFLFTPNTTTVYAQNVTIDDFTYDCQTDPSEPDYGTAALTYVSDSFKASGTVADIPSTVSLDGKDYTVIQIGSLSGDFDGSKELKQVNIPSTVKIIYGRAFANCTKLESIVIPDSVTEIEGQAFVDCTALSSVTLSTNLKSIASLTFTGCTALKSITIPASVESIDKAFPEELESVTFAPGSNLKILNHSAFASTKITSITLPDSITTIGVDAFAGCSELRSVTLPAALTTIEQGAFQNCKNLSTVILPGNLQTIGYSAFAPFDPYADIYSEQHLGTTSLYIPMSVTNMDEGALDTVNPITVYGYQNSTAETYANANKTITFIDIEAAPTASASSNGIKLSWNNIPFASGFKIERSENDGAYTQIGTAAASATSYTDTTTQKDSRYSYRLIIETSQPTVLAGVTTKATNSVVASNDISTPANTTTGGDSTTSTDTGTDTVTTTSTNTDTDNNTASDEDTGSNNTTSSNSTVPVIKNVKNLSGKKVKVTLKSTVSGANGYEIKYATKSNLKGAKVKTFKGKSITLTKLSKGKTYYISVRAFKTSNNKKYYSKWSTVKSVKIKK